MVDQRKLPTQEVYVRCRTAPEVAKAIRTMVIRGAPAIGVAAAYGIALGMGRRTASGPGRRVAGGTVGAARSRGESDSRRGRRQLPVDGRARRGRGQRRRACADAL